MSWKHRTIEDTSWMYWASVLLDLFKMILYFKVWRVTKAANFIHIIYKIYLKKNSVIVNNKHITLFGIVYATVIPTGRSGTGPEAAFSSSSVVSDTNSMPLH